MATLKILDVTKVRETALGEMIALQGNHGSTVKSALKTQPGFQLPVWASFWVEQVISFARAVPNSPWPAPALTLPQGKGDLQDVSIWLTTISCTSNEEASASMGSWTRWHPACPTSQHYAMILKGAGNKLAPSPVVANNCPIHYIEKKGSWSQAPFSVCTHTPLYLSIWHLHPQPATPLSREDGRRKYWSPYQILGSITSQDAETWLSWVAHCCQKMTMTFLMY